MAVSKPKHRVWVFGPFCLNESERVLLREGAPVALTPKVFDTLVALVERGGHLVEKAELIDRLWPDTFVEEGTLARNISDLRKALGAEKYVETVPKRGYRFVAPVREVYDDSAALIVEKTTEANFVIEEEEVAAESDVANAYGQPPLRQAAHPKARRSGRGLRVFLPVSLAVIVLAAVGAIGLRELFKPKTTPGETRAIFQAMQMTRFTASGNVLTAAVSPDGKYVATVVDEGGFQSLWVRQVAANTSAVRLIAPAPVDYWGLTFSNDSNFIYYVSWVRNQSDAELYQLPALGGTPRRLPTPIDTPISFSPTGDRFAYVVSSSSKGESYLKVADANGGEIETLVKRRNPEFFTAYPGGPAWSPDGRLIACVAGGPVEGDSRRVHVFVTNVEDRQERLLTDQGWYNIGRLAWLGDGSGLVISAREQMDGPRQLWFVSYPEGAARRITNDLHDYDCPSLSADGKTLAAVQTLEAFSISTGEDASGESEIFSEVGSGREGIAWTPDQRVVYCSRAGDNWDIWLMNKDGSGQRQLTLDAHNDLFPAVSPDGRYVFFASDRAGAFNIWRMEIDGGNPTQLTRGGKEILPNVTPDGRWVIYQQGPGFGLDTTSIWRVPAQGGEPERLADRLTQKPAASPDGRLLAYVYLDDKEWGLAVRLLENGEVEKRFPFPSTVASRVFRWTPDGKSLAYIANEKGASNIWLQPLSGERPSRLTDFKAGQLISFAWSGDGQWLSFLRHSSTSDVVLLREFK